MTTGLNEYEIIKGLAGGTEEYVRCVYDLYYKPLCYFANRLTGNTQVAEDIAVDSFVKMLEKRDFISLLSVKSFLFTAVRNSCIDYLRKQKVSKKYGRELAYLIQPSESVADEEMLKAKLLQTIYAEMETLPLQCKTVFKAVFMEGKSTGDIAGEMGISKQTVLNQKATALRVLRTKLQERGLHTTAMLLIATMLKS